MAWAAFPYPEAAYRHTAVSLKKAWPRLHVGDVESLPKNPALIEAWIAFHQGDFEYAAMLGLAEGMTGFSVANKATCMVATYLEKSAANKHGAFQQVAKRCETQQAEQPKNVAGYYWHGYALARHAQSISVLKALVQGIGGKAKNSLDTAVRLAPKHADAHIALGTFHAAIVDKVGVMLAELTYGANKDTAYQHFNNALTLTPESAIARIEYANALARLGGKQKMDEAAALYQAAAASAPADAMERLDVEIAKDGLES